LVPPLPWHGCPSTAPSTGWPDLRQRTLALRTAPGSHRSRLPSHVRRPDARSKDAAVTRTLGMSCARTEKARICRPFPFIGETGFEPATARPPAGCATRLRHSPWLSRKRATGIEPALEAWKASVQPQHFARSGRPDDSRGNGLRLRVRRAYPGSDRAVRRIFTPRVRGDGFPGTTGSCRSLVSTSRRCTTRRDTRTRRSRRRALSRLS
jgi:hypothetical protein